MPTFEAVDFYNLDELPTADKRRIRDAVRQSVQERFLPVVGQHYTFPMNSYRTSPNSVSSNRASSYGCVGPGVDSETVQVLGDKS